MTKQLSIKHQKLFFLKEVAIGVLAILSVGLVLFELSGVASERQANDIARVDFWIACIFLVDFILSLLTAANRKHYLKNNWYFLLAAIPLTDTLTGSLRILRVLSLIRLIRAGGHLVFWRRS